MPQINVPANQLRTENKEKEKIPANALEADPELAELQQRLNAMSS